MPMLPHLPGVHIGHAELSDRPTGTTVILTPAGAVAAVDVRGAAPGTRETDLLDPSNTVATVHAVTLTGGSAYGLAAATGVMKYLAERGHGLQVGPALVPIVPAAVLFDLFLGDWRLHPDATTGYRAAAAALAAQDPPQMGNVGAGAGATIGKLLDPMSAMRGGIGHASARVGTTVVAAIVACNAVGDVRDPANGSLVAGARTAPDATTLADTTATLLRGGQGLALLNGSTETSTAPASSNTPVSSNIPANSNVPGSATGSGSATTIGAVITNAALTKATAKRLATCAHDGIARTVDPAHTTMDGDTMFALATGTEPGPPDLVLLCTLAAQVTAAAILAGIRAATGLRMGPLWLPSAADL